ncbi:hypothetical protein [Luteolibacter sp. Populi]|uniref:hypothetical protein n=1 Tax=Luteolibacter sp. Populi TaxID=3230487 RepID=UPI0034656103
MLKRLILPALFAIALSSCTIPVTGKGSIPQAAASVQIGKTTYQELQAELGAPPLSDRKGDRQIANWLTSGVGMGAASVMGTNDIVMNSLGVEYDRSGIVRRSVSHINKRKNTLATPFHTSHVAGASRDPGRFSRMKHVSQIEAELGSPQAKRISFEGESWVWVGYPGSSGNGVFTAELDRNGRVLRTALK